MDRVADTHSWYSRSVGRISRRERAIPKRGGSCQTFNTDESNDAESCREVLAKHRNRKNNTNEHFYLCNGARTNPTLHMDLNSVTEWQKAQNGELYHAFVPELLAARDRCSAACNAFNDNRDQKRRTLVELWRA